MNGGVFLLEREESTLLGIACNSVVDFPIEITHQAVDEGQQLLLNYAILLASHLHLAIFYYSYLRLLLGLNLDWLCL